MSIFSRGGKGVKTARACNYIMTSLHWIQTSEEAEVLYDPSAPV